MPALTGSDRVIAGRYRLLSVLGHGGMGTVWRAHDAVLDRQVAIKEVSPPPGVTLDEGQILRERTLREARTAARLSHPNVVTIFDVVEDDEKPWIVMELVEDRSLREIVERDGPLSPAQAAAVGLQLLGALRAAHELGVVHRDVKPGNVLIEAGGRAVLADFGIARATGSPSLTNSGVLVGSPSYIAPERARGELGGPASDLWSLGATLYAAVEGRPAYERDGAWATLAAVVTQDPDPPERVGPLWPVISELLNRDPDRRLGAQAAERMLRQVAGTRDPEGAIRMGGTAASAVAGAAGELAAAEKTRAFHGQHPLASPPSGLPDRSTPVPAGLAPGLLPGSGPPGYRPQTMVPIQPRRGRSPQSRPGRVFWLGALAAVAALLTGGAALVASQAGRPQESSPSPSGRANTAGASPGRPGSGSPGHGSPGRRLNEHAPPGQQGEGGGPAGGMAALPPGYHEYRDPTGFSIGVPAGWSVSPQGHYVYITPPSGGMYLLIDQTGQPRPDPLADWRQQEAARRGTYADYHLIRLVAVHYAEAERAADWEFTYTGRGGPTHVLNRNVLANSQHAYALYWSTPASAWPADYHYFQAFAATFRPAGRIGAAGS